MLTLTGLNIRQEKGRMMNRIIAEYASKDMTILYIQEDNCVVGMCISIASLLQRMGKQWRWFLLL